MKRKKHLKKNSSNWLVEYAIAKYAEALEVVPRTLAENTGLDDTEILSKLYKAHSDGDKAEKEKEKEKAEKGDEKEEKEKEKGTEERIKLA